MKNKFKNSNENKTPAKTNEILSDSDAIQYEKIIVEKLGEGEDYYQTVENERQEIFKSNKAAQRRSSISILILFISAIVAIYFANKEDLKFISWIFCGIGLGSILVFSVINKRIARPDPKGYIKRASLAINKYVFNDKNFSDVVFFADRKAILDDYKNDDLFENIVDIASRNVVEAKYKDLPFKISEVALFKTKTPKSRETYFIGKIFECSNSYDFEGKIVLIKNGETKIDQPNQLFELEHVEESQFFNVFASKGLSFAKILNKNFIEMIKNLEVKDHLLNVTILVEKGRTCAYISYDDDVITLPFYNPLKKEAISQFKENLNEFLEGIK